MGVITMGRPGKRIDHGKTRPPILTKINFIGVAPHAPAIMAACAHVGH